MKNTFNPVAECGEKKKAWQSPQVIALNLNQNTQGGTAGTIFEDAKGEHGIARSL